MNSINGVVLLLLPVDDSSLKNNSSLTDWLLGQEDKMGLSTLVRLNLRKEFFGIEAIWKD